MFETSRREKTSNWGEYVALQRSLSEESYIAAMKQSLFKIAAAVALAAASVSCMTTYDPYGRPVQSVDPAVAVAGVAAAGLVGYAAGRDHDHYYGRPRYSYGPYYGGPRPYYRPYYRPYARPYYRHCY